MASSPPPPDQPGSQRPVNLRGINISRTDMNLIAIQIRNNAIVPETGPAAPEPSIAPPQPPAPPQPESPPQPLQPAQPSIGMSARPGAHKRRARPRMRQPAPTVPPTSPRAERRPVSDPQPEPESPAPSLPLKPRRIPSAPQPDREAPPPPTQVETPAPEPEAPVPAPAPELPPIPRPTVLPQIVPVLPEPREEAPVQAPPAVFPPTPFFWKPVEVLVPDCGIKVYQDQNGVWQHNVDKSNKRLYNKATRLLDAMQRAVGSAERLTYLTRAKWAKTRELTFSEFRELELSSDPLDKPAVIKGKIDRDTGVQNYAQLRLWAFLAKLFPQAKFPALAYNRAREQWVEPQLSLENKEIPPRFVAKERPHQTNSTTFRYLFELVIGRINLGVEKITVEHLGGRVETIIRPRRIENTNQLLMHLKEQGLIYQSQVEEHWYDALDMSDEGLEYVDEGWCNIWRDWQPEGVQEPSTAPTQPLPPAPEKSILKNKDGQEKTSLGKKYLKRRQLWFADNKQVLLYEREVAAIPKKVNDSTDACCDVQDRGFFPVESMLKLNVTITDQNIVDPKWKHEPNPYPGPRPRFQPKLELQFESESDTEDEC